MYNKESHKNVSLTGKIKAMIVYPRKGIVVVYAAIFHNIENRSLRFINFVIPTAIYVTIDNKTNTITVSGK